MEKISKLADMLLNSSMTMVLTGAGASTESGLMDFRSPRGMWKWKDPMTLATVDALYNNTQEFHAFYTYRIEALSKVRPNRTHLILSRWQQANIVHNLITQNVDGLHQRAGSRNVIELHGTLSRVRCIDCSSEYSSRLFLQKRYTCPGCSGLLRPCVVLFGESLPRDRLNRAFEAASKSRLLLVIGSSLQVSPANMLPVECKNSGGSVVIINREPTPLDGIADLIFHGNSGDVLDKAMEILQ